MARRDANCMVNEMFTEFEKMDAAVVGTSMDGCIQRNPTKEIESSG